MRQYVNECCCTPTCDIFWLGSLFAHRASPALSIQTACSFLNVFRGCCSSEWQTADAAQSEKLLQMLLTQRFLLKLSTASHHKTEAASDSSIFILQEADESKRGAVKSRSFGLQQMAWNIHICSVFLQTPLKWKKSVLMCDERKRRRESDAVVTVERLLMVHLRLCRLSNTISPASSEKSFRQLHSTANTHTNVG